MAFPVDAGSVSARVCYGFGVTEVDDDVGTGQIHHPPPPPRHHHHELDDNARKNVQQAQRQDPESLKLYIGKGPTENLRPRNRHRIWKM
jgi:hypothetical protein